LRPLEKGISSIAMGIGKKKSDVLMTAYVAKATTCIGIYVGLVTKRWKRMGERMNT